MRLIDADAYIDYCTKEWIPLNVDAVNEQPTIEPDKEHTNKRTETHECDCSQNWIVECTHVICTVCKEEYEDYGVERWKWCPVCGARLRHPYAEVDDG